MKRLRNVLILTGLCGVIALIGVLNPDTERAQGLPTLASLPTEGVTMILTLPPPTGTITAVVTEATVSDDLGIISVEQGELAQRTVVQFWVRRNDRGEISLSGLQRHMTEIVCAVRDQVPEGYGMRLGGRQPSRATVVTATLTAEQVQAMDCSRGFDWSTAEEYSPPTMFVIP